ncbi:glycoside hydrolase family 2 TIM barrel-domain containing protein [Niabella terrae]
MKKLTLLSCLALMICLNGLIAQPLPTELLTPEIVSVNRMPMRATAFAYESRALAEKRNREDSRYFLSLNGNWKFNWVQNPQERPQRFYETDFDDSKWENFPVPANWELNGYGLPIYVNQPYEFAGRKLTGSRMNPPFDIPQDNNPVGSYRKTVTLPASWNGRQVFIHLGAVKSAFFIWVNGKKVGYSEDSKLAAEFDITEYVHPGENLVALQVYRWSDASYLECQDMWRISGIEREVYLYATPLLDIRDFKVRSTLVNDYKDGQLQLDIEVNNYRKDQHTNHSKPDTFSVAVELQDAEGNAVYNASSEGIKKVLGRYKTDLSFAKNIPQVKAWSAELPYLYTLYITLKDKSGNLLEVVPVRLGFRTVEIKGRDFLVNGKRVFFKGVNRHEHNARTGHTLTAADMRKDMEMMKKLNVNAVRHSHYPPSPYWMELCDEYGLYVIDEANIESHGRYYDLEYSLANDKKWRVPHLERIQRMYERDKNHTSVITWSLGNEAGNGVNMYEAYDWLKARDSRPVQYERAESDYNTDVLCPQYPSPGWVAGWRNSKDNRPLIMSEYAHIMGNSLGNFKDYWDAIESTPGAQGGYVWEWIDQAIDTVKDGKRIMAYGGDFPLTGPVNEDFSDNNFCVKGVVTAYRQLTPMAVELKKVHQYIKSVYKGNNEIGIANRYDFRDLSNVQLDWELLEDGRVVEKGTNNKLRLQSGEVINMILPVKTRPKEGKEYFLNLHYRLKKSEPFLEKGYEIASEQFKWAGGVTAVAPDFSKGTVKVSEAGNILVVQGRHFTAEFDTKAGLLTAYSADNATLISSGPQPAFYRAPTDNDIGAGLNKSLRNWRDAYQKGELTDVRKDPLDGHAYKITFVKTLLNGKATTEQSFTVASDGSVLVENHFTIASDAGKLLMRIGNDMQVARKLNRIRWYGRGPWENYVDRQYASEVGLFEQRLEQQYFPYARPQESGNKTGVRWMSLTAANGRGLKIVCTDSLLSVAALPYSLDALDPAPEKHQYHSGELEAGDAVYMHIDLRQLGVQGIDSWGSLPLKKYWVLPGEYQYSYLIQPL